MVPVPESPRYNTVSKKALTFLLTHKLNSLPINPSDIVQKLGCSIRTYSFHAKKLKCTVQDICEACGSIDGYSIYDEVTGKYKIIYNDKISSTARIRFTLMHEIAHIYLNHFIDFEQTIICRGGLIDQELDILDREANHFASKVLAPEIILLHTGWKQPHIIRKHCALSTEASKYKAEKVIEMEKTRDFITNLEVRVLRQFHDFIHQRVCPICSHHFIIPNSKYCPVCGNKSISWGMNKSMIYEEIILDNNSKAQVCPICDNEQVMPEGDYCHICGVYLVNKCLGKLIDYDQDNEPIFAGACDTLLPGNARYCPYCGGRSSYFHYRILLEWNYSEEEDKKEGTTTIMFPEEEIPF